MTIDELKNWAEERGIKTYWETIYIVSSEGAVPQALEMDHLTVDEDGSVIIQL